MWTATAWSVLPAIISAMVVVVIDAQVIVTLVLVVTPASGAMMDII
jgi:hypothetical protein